MVCRCRGRGRRRLFSKHSAVLPVGAQPLRLADLISLAALPALAIGLATLTARLVADDGADAGRARSR